MPLSRHAPRLLSKVAHKPWARVEDHEDQDIRTTTARQRSFKTLDESPRSASDVDAEPASSGESDILISSADIPSSFDRNGRSLASKLPAPPGRRATRRVGTEGGVDEPPRKIQKTSDDEDFHIFGGSNPKKAKKVGRGAADPFRVPVSRVQTYERSKPENKLKMPAMTAPRSRSSGSAFKQIPSLTPSPSNKSTTSSREKNDPYRGAEDYVDVSARLDSGRIPEKTERKVRRSKGSQGPSRIDGKGKHERQTQRNIDYSPPRSSGPEFKLPELAAQIDPEELKREIEEERLREAVQAAAQIPDEGPCPMRCGKILKREQLETLDPKASIREQQQFCRNHRVTDAEDQWRKNNYPVIDWERLPKKLKRYDKELVRMIQCPHELWFRKEMEERNRRGKDRTIMQHLENEGMQGIGIGYYGPKGADIMADYITKNYAADLRDRAGNDKIMGNRGTTAYIQMVLVLELTTLLVKKDMNVDDITARRIMSESTIVGDLLHPSEGGKTSRRRGRIVVDGEDRLEEG